MIPAFDQYKQRFQLESSDVIKPGLAAIEEAMEMLGHPELSVPTVHVAGTNGKGSTIAMLEAICREHDLKTLTFTSPCIEDVHDQIKLNNRPLAPFQMDEIFTQLQQAGLSGLLTDFELLTAVAFMACKLYKPDIAIIEAGLGGRFDSTNVVQPLVAVVPSIALEHTNFLGDTLAKIAYHKSGILKTNVSAVLGQLPDEALAVFKEEAQKQQVSLKMDGEDFEVLIGDTYVQGLLEIHHLTRRLKGAHQRHNMGVAITAFVEVAQKLSITMHDDAIRKAIAHAAVPGRFEQLSTNVFLDGAHNPASAASLRKTIEELYPDTPIHIVMGILKDKDVDGVLRELERVCDDFTFVDVELEQTRLMPAETLMAHSHAGQKQTASSALQAVLSKRNEQGIVILTGSLYLLAQWRHTLQNALGAQ